MKNELDNAYLRQQAGEYLKNSYLEAIQRCKQIQTPQLSKLGLELPEDKAEALKSLTAEKEIRVHLKEELKLKKRELTEAQSQIKRLNSQLAAVPQLLTTAQAATAALERHLNYGEVQEAEGGSEGRSV
mmetsp:Transcript_24872/g.43742  ORF Transcript_24872/g.43742 Transcript_24872/m.43742 type:complete len:129 (+) Transcript_24872:167-553(+)